MLFAIKCSEASKCTYVPSETFYLLLHSTSQIIDMIQTKDFLFLDVVPTVSKKSINELPLATAVHLLI